MMLGSIFLHMLNKEKTIWNDIDLNVLMPSTYLRAIFSASCWVPISRLGFGIFLFHMGFYRIASQTDTFSQGFPIMGKSEDKACKNGASTPQETLMLWAGSVACVLTGAVTFAIITFIFLEKPAEEAVEAVNEDELKARKRLK